MEDKGEFWKGTINNVISGFGQYLAAKEQVKAQTQITQTAASEASKAIQSIAVVGVVGFLAYILTGLIFGRKR